MDSISLSTSTVWKKIDAHKSEISDLHLRDLFLTDPDRVPKFSASLGDFYVDYSKNRITDETVSLLIQLAEERNLAGQIQSLMRGDKINTTENRAALHTVLRYPAGSQFIHDDEDLVQLIQNEMDKLETFVNDIHAGNICGYSGKAIDTIINIGIGGSDLGPRLVTEALNEYQYAFGIDVKYVANLDAQEIYKVLENLDPQSCLFIVTSKSFTTLETFANAETAKSWLIDNGCTDINKHFIAVTSNLEATKQFGISDDKVFQLWDWVGGRYSVWSTVGISVAIALGMENFKYFQQGAHAMDRHFSETPFDNNIPVILGLLDIWYNNFLDAETLTVVPYDQRLRLLPEYLSQLVMESNGKSVTRENARIDVNTSHIVWGAIGTNSQHAYFQMLHQGTRLIPVEFLLPMHSSRDEKNHHKLVANCLAQSKALMLGKDDVDDPHRHFDGNHPSTTIMYDNLTPETMGMLLAMYEHRTYVQAAIWGINAFDQWGVELGKVLAKEIIAELETGQLDPNLHDASTASLMARYLNKD
jgi:glucose-6-phosphate isomerase